MTFNQRNAHTRDTLIDFDPERHVYRFGDEEYESVTTVVDDCFEKFDAVKWARIKSPADPHALLAQWEAKGREARELGTLMHDRIERHYLGQDVSAEAGGDPTFARFLDFSRAHPLTPYRTEWRIFSERYKIAGTLDFLAVEADGSLSIYDWKRSTKVVDRSGRVIDNCHGRHAMPPIASLPDTTYNHYALQVSIYRFILAEHYGIDVARARLGVFHPDMPRHYCVELPYLLDEVLTLLSSRCR